MKLVELSVRGRVRGSELGEGAYYLRIEQRDVLGKLKSMGAILGSEVAGIVKEKVDEFTTLADLVAAKFRERFPEEESLVEDPVQMWLSDSSGFCLCKRLLLKGVADRASIDEAIEEAKKKLLEEDVYLAVKDLVK